jgi:hypothetical protein
MSVAAAVLAVASLAAVPAAAGEGPARLSVGEGKLSADGAAARVPIVVSCPQGWRYSVGVHLVQEVGGKVTQGGSHFDGLCTGGREERDVYVKVAAEHPDARAFRAGPAAATVRLAANEQAKPVHRPAFMLPVCPLGMLCHPGAALAPTPKPLGSGTDSYDGSIQLRA